MNIDIPRLRSDMRELEQRMRATKEPLRRPWTEPMVEVQAEQLRLAAQLTALYTLRAWARARLHRTQPPRYLRDSHEALGMPLRWDAQRHNREVAERAAERYRLIPQTSSGEVIDMPRSITQGAVGEG